MAKTPAILSVQEQSGQRLKIKWTVIVDGRPGNFGPYSVPLATLSFEVAKVRTCLNDLVAEYNNRTYDYESALKKLANAGSGLEFLLFDGVGDNEGGGEAKKAKNWLADQNPGSVQMTVSTDGTVHVPWGLLFSGKIPEETEARDDYSGFWAFRYELATLHIAMDPHQFEQGVEESGFRVVSLVDGKALKDVKQSLPAKEQALLEALLARPLGAVFNTDEGKLYLKQVAESDCLLNVFSHATGQEIMLSPDSLSVADFRRHFLHPRQTTQNRQAEALLFLNGCDTAVGDMDNSFLSATAEPGCAGFIGSEAKLPDEFALRAGLVVLHGLLREGLTAHQVVKRLWYEHWPLGLLYGCYAVPDFKVAVGAPVALPDYLRGVNLSQK